MAFLCPVRIRNNNRKSKKKKGEIIPAVESDVIGSIETLVRVGIEKHNINKGNGVELLQRMLVLHDFTPCVDDELEVKRNDTVSLLYRENDWAYVITDNNNEGFIPFSYLNNIINNINHFYKDPFGPSYIVLYSFEARDENDVSVSRGEQITVLNKDDPDWFWVAVKRTQVQEEGFVPSAFVFPLNNINNDNNNKEITNTNVDNQHQQLEGTELVMLYDYKAQAPDDLSVRRGDWVYADLTHQTVEGWLWAFAPKHKKYGFIPKAYARPPAMTSL